MSLHYGKPGTFRVRGLQRAQLRDVSRKLRGLLAFNIKVALRVPPQALFTAPQLADIIDAKAVVDALIAQKN